MNTTSRLTIPMDDNLRSSLSARADELGFDSAQALLRYVSKAIVDRREVTFGEPDDDWGPPPEHVVKRWEEELADLPRQLEAGEAHSFDNVEDALKHLHSL